MVIKNNLKKVEKPKKEFVCDVLVVGSGVTGYAAGMYSARFNLKTIVVGELPGGTITLTNEVSNYPGFKELTGTELAEKLKDHALDYDIMINDEKIEDIKKVDGGFVAESHSSVYKTKTIIYATGTSSKKLEVPGEDKFFAKGVHTCALCDGPFYKDKILAVVGGSDSAAKEALLLTQFAKKVYIIYRGDKIRPEPINGDKVEKNKKIEVITNTNVVEISGEGKVKSVVLDKDYDGKSELLLDGVFVEIGHIPRSELATKVGVKLNSKGEIIIDRHSKTNVEGFFAAGDVVDTTFKQAITGVAEGVTASYFAFQLVSAKN